MELGEHVKTCRMLCERLSQQWPQFALDGTQNIWIVKPGAKSRGRGKLYCGSQTQYFAS